MTLKPDAFPSPEIESIQAELAAMRRDVAGMAGTIREIRSLVGPFGVPLPDGTMLVQTIHGVKFCIDPMDMIIAPNLIIYRQWESDLSALMIGAVTKDTVFVDIGANFGYFTCLLGGRISNQGNGKIYSVEPNPAMINLLNRNRAINWSMCPIEVHECAVAAQAGTADFEVPTNRASNASLVPNAAKSAPAAGEPAKNIFRVAVKRIDDIIPVGTKVDLMKIDVEGHEWSALAGAARVISESPDIKIVMEWSMAQMLTAGYPVNQMADQFAQLGLQAHLVPQNRIIAELGPRLTAAQLAGLRYDNIVLIRTKP